MTGYDEMPMYLATYAAKVLSLIEDIANPNVTDSGPFIGKVIIEDDSGT